MWVYLFLSCLLSLDWISISFSHMQLTLLASLNYSIIILCKNHQSILKKVSDSQETKKWTWMPHQGDRHPTFFPSCVGHQWPPVPNTDNNTLELRDYLALLVTSDSQGLNRKFSVSNQHVSEYLRLAVIGLNMQDASCFRELLISLSTKPLRQKANVNCVYIYSIKS